MPLGSRADSSLARPGPCLPHNDHHPVTASSHSGSSFTLGGSRHRPSAPTSDYLDAILPLSDLLWASVYRTATLHACRCRLLLLLVLPTNLSWPRPTRFIEAHWHTADHPIQKIRSSRPQQSTAEHHHTQSSSFPEGSTQPRDAEPAVTHISSQGEAPDTTSLDIPAVRGRIHRPRYLTTLL